tara:strand:- start:362 stop:478 length:117 start_codon:yes stop_codon:yes gene_type:complete
MVEQEAQEDQEALMVIILAVQVTHLQLVPHKEILVEIV